LGYPDYLHMFAAGLLGVVERLLWLSVVPAYVVGVGVRPEHAPAFARRGPGNGTA
jgi:hypothetical protein